MRERQIPRATRDAGGGIYVIQVHAAYYTDPDQTLCSAGRGLHKGRKLKDGTSLQIAADNKDVTCKGCKRLLYL